MNNFNTIDQEMMDQVIREAYEAGKFDRLLAKKQFVGLFWFADDYSSLVRTEGLMEISPNEFVSARGETIEPDGCHLEYEKDLTIPRGRVVFCDGVFDICVGTDIPAETNFQEIKRAFGLIWLDDSKVQIFQNHHWNRRSK
jgi:hypothetical protein